MIICLGSLALCCSVCCGIISFWFMRLQRVSKLIERLLRKFSVLFWNITENCLLFQNIIKKCLVCNRCWRLSCFKWSLKILLIAIIAENGFKSLSELSHFTMVLLYYTRQLLSGMNRNETSTVSIDNLTQDSFQRYFRTKRFSAIFSTQNMTVLMDNLKQVFDNDLKQDSSPRYFNCVEIFLILSNYCSLT